VLQKSKFKVNANKKRWHVLNERFQRLKFRLSNNPWNNGSQLMNPDISGAIITLSSSLLILNSQCVEGAKYVRVL